MYNTMQQRDGDFVIYSFLLEDIGNYMGVPLGHMLYKVSSSALSTTDSLFVADTTYCGIRHLDRDPDGEGNIRAFFEYDEDSDSTYLRIQHFTDSDLHAVPGEDVVTPVCEGFTTLGSTLLDSRGDLILKYGREHPNEPEVYDEYVARVGLDGTLKHHVLFEDSIRLSSHLRERGGSPLQYYQVKRAANNNIAVTIVDSLFQKNTVILNRILRSVYISDQVTEYEYLHFHDLSYFDLVPIGGNEVLVAAPYTQDTNFSPNQNVRQGMAVAKYDLRTMQVKDYVVLSEYTGQSNQWKCNWLKVMADGTVYFAYKKPIETYINVVKMDTDLNVEWIRRCKTNGIDRLHADFGHSILFDDGQGNEKGVAWSGYAYRGNTPGLAYFFLNHDGTVGTNDMDIEVRPYAFYPNPAQDRLRLNYSPDVKPAQIELYDLQGRLVRSQGSGLESLSLQGLAAGQYVMKVTMADGTTFSDKVVKE